jgi:hypothetical protein
MIGFWLRCACHAHRRPPYIATAGGKQCSIERPARAKHPNLLATHHRRAGTGNRRRQASTGRSLTTLTMSMLKKYVWTAGIPPTQTVILTRTASVDRRKWTCTDNLGPKCVGPLTDVIRRAAPIKTGKRCVTVVSDAKGAESDYDHLLLFFLSKEPKADLTDRPACVVWWHKHELQR